MSARDEQPRGEFYAWVSIPWDGPFVPPPFSYLTENYHALEAAPPKRGIRTPFLWPPRVST